MNIKPTLGVVAISYNEEVDLPGFLEHLIEWVDEIVIVDDGSTDTTEEIASKYGPKINFIKSKREAGEYYSDQRNKGIDHAKSDWLLHMDIDERVTKELSVEILTAISSPDYDAYKFRRLNYFFHRPMKGVGWADWNLVHLAKREVFRFGGMFHETIDLTISTEKIGQLTNKMHHFNDDSYSERLKKSMTYQEEVVLSLEKRNIKVSLGNMIIALLKEFVVKYFYKKGILDGTPGFISAFHSSFAIFKAYALLWEKQHKIQRKDLEQTFIKKNK
jgi:(heptosyl)LPS beta-1,4-glucosyltransferase